VAKSRYNIERLRKKFSEFDKIAKEDIKVILSSSAQIIVVSAKRKAPDNFGKLRQSIGREPKKEGFQQVIFANGSNIAPYAPFLEFGTKMYVKVPIELQSEAIKFKGYKSGSFDDFLDSIKIWVEKKGFASTYSIKTRNKTSSVDSRANVDRAAYMIAMSILKRGIKPRPYLWPAFVEERDKIPEKMDKMLQRSARNFNKD